jgi:hypothetical protein
MKLIQKGGSSMRSRTRLLVLITVMLAILIGASTAMAKERVVQVLLPNCE